MPKEEQVYFWIITYFSLSFHPHIAMDSPLFAKAGNTLKAQTFWTQKSIGNSVTGKLAKCEFARSSNI
jgi:hypothetical protein